MGFIANLRNRIWILEDENKGMRDEIAQLRDQFISETRKYAALYQSYAELNLAEIKGRETIAYLSNDVKFEKDYRIATQKNNEMMRKNLARISKWANRLYDENQNLKEENKRANEKAEYNRGLIQFWRSMCKRAQKKNQGYEIAIRETNAVLAYKNDRIAELEMLLKSVRADNEEMNQIIHAQAREVSELRDGIDRLENDPESVIEYVAEITVAHFEHVNDIIGIAPCGNSCPVKRDSSGRMYDAHEINCPEYVDFDIDNIRY